MNYTRAVAARRTEPRSITTAEELKTELEDSAPGVTLRAAAVIAGLVEIHPDVLFAVLKERARLLTPSARAFMCCAAERCGRETEARIILGISPNAADEAKYYRAAYMASIRWRENHKPGLADAEIARMNTATIAPQLIA